MDKNKKHSFTLIELLLVVAISIILSAVGLASYNEFSQEKKLDNETQRLKDVVELARKKAQSGDSSQCSSADSSITPRVGKYTVTSSATSYQLIPNCPGANPTPINYQVDPVIELQAPFPTVDFKPLSATTAAGCFIIKNTSSAKCKYVKVESSGSVCSGSCSCASCICSSC